MGNNFSKNLRYLRVKRNISQNKMSELVGVNQSTIGRWESNDIVPSIENVENVAKVLNVPLTDILFKDFLIEDAQPLQEPDFLFSENNKTKLLESIEKYVDGDLNKELLVKCSCLSNTDVQKALVLINRYLVEQGDYYKESLNSDIWTLNCYKPYNHYVEMEMYWDFYCDLILDNIIYCKDLYNKAIEKIKNVYNNSNEAEMIILGLKILQKNLLTNYDNLLEFMRAIFDNK